MRDCSWDVPGRICEGEHRKTVYSVGQCARILGVSAKTLRHYDAIGLVSPATVGRENQYRYYSRGQLPALRRIVFLRELGVGLEVIRELLRGGALDDPERLGAILEEHARELRREIDARRALLGHVERAAALAAGDAAAPVRRDVLVKRVPEIHAVGIRRAIHLRELRGLMDEVAALAGDRAAGPPINVYHNPEFDPEFVDVEALVPVSRGANRILPAATVASILQVGTADIDEIGAAYGALYDWIEERGARDVGPPREVMVVGRGSGKAEDEYVMEIQAPIEDARPGTGREGTAKDKGATRW